MFCRVYYVAFEPRVTYSPFFCYLLLLSYLKTHFQSPSRRIAANWDSHPTAEPLLSSCFVLPFFINDQNILFSFPRNTESQRKRNCRGKHGGLSGILRHVSLVHSFLAPEYSPFLDYCVTGQLHRMGSLSGAKHAFTPSISLSFFSFGQVVHLLGIFILGGLTRSLLSTSLSER